MSSPHTFIRFDQELQAIRTLILTMGGQVEEAIATASKALETRNEALAAEVVRGDAGIDLLEDDVNHQVVRVLALHQPHAQDLRAVIGVMKMAGDLERLGDYAKNMAKRVKVLSSGQDIEGAGASLRRQAREVSEMLHDMLDAFARGDVALARAVIARDVEVDDMTNALFREFITHMMADPRNITACLHYTFIAKNVERMGDLVTGCAEQVVFLVTGELPGDRARGSSTSEIG